MTEAERAALVEQVARMMCETAGDDWREGRDYWIRKARAILAAIEPAIRADEREKVREQATSDEAVERATDLVRRELDRIEAVMTDPITLQRHMARRCASAAIRAALGVEP